jgi:3-keto-L-gulonate-6-phosphate decarboxylase
MKPIVQISLDIINLNEALETATMAMRAGVDWLEAGTPFILAGRFAWCKETYGKYFLVFQ